MATVSSLSAPGVEVREYDESLRITSNTGTTVLVPGFAAQGPVEEILTVGSIEDFETIYGVPTNAAERYFYYTCLGILNNSGPGTTLLTTRLSYGNGEGDNVQNAYTLLAYPAIPYVKNSNNKKGYAYFDISESLKDYLTIEPITNPTTTNTFSTETPEVEIVLTDNSLKDTIKVYGLTQASDSSLPAVTTDTAVEAHKLSISWTADGKTSITSPLDVYTTFDGKTLAIEAAGQLYDETNNKVYGFVNISTTYEDNEAADLSEAFTQKKSDATTKEYVKSGYRFVAPSTDAISLGDKIEVYTQKTITTTEANTTAEANNQTPNDLNPTEDDVTYLLGAPATYTVSLSEYYNILANDLFKWSKTSNTFDSTSGNFGGDIVENLGKAAFIAINTSRGTINSSFEGHYLGITDNLFNEPSEDYILSACRGVKFNSWVKGADVTSGIVDYQVTSDEFTAIDSSRLDFHTDSNNRGSISNILQQGVSSFDTSSKEFDDTLNLALFKLKKSPTGTESMKLTYSIVEKYNASLGKERTYSISNAVTPQPYFIENILENSKNIKIMVNPTIANKIHIDINGNLRGKVRVFSGKLVDTYRTYKQKYLTSPVDSSVVEKTDFSKRVDFNRLNVENWKTLISRVGIDLDSLEELIADPTATSNDYDKFSPCDTLYPFASYSTPKSDNKIVGNVPAKISRALSLVENDEQYPDIDIVCEGGLATVYTYANAKTLISEGTDSLIEGMGAEGDTKPLIFNDDAILQGIEDLRTSRSSLTEDATNVLEDYMSVQNAFLSLANSFQNGGRGDTFYIPDILRGIVIRGKDTKVERLYGTELSNNVYADNTTVKHSWSTSIYSPIKHLVESLTTSYASIYAQFFKILDGFTNEKHWVPASGYMAALMCASDQLQGPWYAGAGLNRGIVQGVLDCALNPNQKQRGDLYKICVNSVPKLANIGITNWGIRTLSKKASAFDQNTCRRTFLFMEKAIKKLLRYYLFEPNNSYTQLSIYNEIEPYMESIKNQGGVYSYQVRCDMTNNTPEIVNAGNLAVDVSAAPTRTAEFIVLNMTANKYTQEVASSEFGI